ncbi:MAG: 23S rRNA (guanosine(2251)-2'-O)-methyltransferase RlmB [Candidatus Omnitrophota bacterium]|nr:23S rRNA (guanosine(2251)-2'-O)-methyltransferase RlmB [Candidatus Omnitrophota bacterium]
MTRNRENNAMLLFGRNSVLERLKANPKTVKNILVQEGFNDTVIMDIIRSRKIPFKHVSEKELLKLKHTERLHGIVAEVGEFKYLSFDQLQDKFNEKRLSFILLDGVTDPQNLGAIIRITACFGGFAVVIPERDSCEVNETVLNIASGGENYVPVCRVNNLSNALIHAKKSGYWIAGTVVEAGDDLNKISFPFPLCLVLGSEGKGIHHGVQKQLELRVTLPMRGAALSFNVAMASAIFCYEITRQKNSA